MFGWHTSNLQEILKSFKYVFEVVNFYLFQFSKEALCCQPYISAGLMMGATFMLYIKHYLTVEEIDSEEGVMRKYCVKYIYTLHPK